MAVDLFPVSYSTLACSALVTRVLPLYGIESVASCQLWNRGLSDVYLVETAEERYILRVSHHHWRSKSDIDFELELLDFLWQRHIPVAHPLRTKQGDLSIEIHAPEGQRYITLFTYAPGEVALGDLNPKQAYTFGETVAKFHQTTLDFESSTQRQALTLEHLLDESFLAITPCLQHRPQDQHYLQETIACIQQQLQDIPQEPPFWVICWGDPHSGNAHFTEEGQLTLFDFDQCGYGWRAFDIAKFLQVSSRTGISKRVREAFLNGYQDVQAITSREFSSLQSFTQAAHIWMWAISLTWWTRHSCSRLDDHFASLRLQQLKLLRSPDWQLF